jgi:hypothetical protein
METVSGFLELLNNWLNGFFIAIVQTVKTSKQFGTFRVNVFPKNLTVVVGGSLNIRLQVPIDGQRICSYIPPLSRQESTTDSDRVRFLKSEPCGIQIKNVTKSNSGVWRLYSKLNNVDKKEGRTMVKVVDKIDDRAYGTDLSVVPERIPRDREMKYCIVRNSEQIEISTHECKPPENSDPDDDFEIQLGIQGHLNEFRRYMKEAVKSKFRREN